MSYLELKRITYHLRVASGGVVGVVVGSNGEPPCTVTVIWSGLPIELEWKAGDRCLWWYWLGLVEGGVEYVCNAFTCWTCLPLLVN